MMKIQEIASVRYDNFFKDGQPLVWYSKQNNVYEYFNAAGENPVTGKELKPITTYIIQGQILKKIMLLLRQNQKRKVLQNRLF